MSKRPLVFLDTETDGLGPRRHAWEIAMVRREPDGTERETQFFLPLDASNAESGALNIGRFYERHPQGVALSRMPTPPAQWGVLSDVTPATLGHRPAAPTLTPVPKAARVIAQWTFGATIVGANPAFDVHIIERMLRGNGYEPRWHYRTRDVEAMVCAITEPDMGGLAACANAMGVEVDPKLEHTAMGDVRVVMGIWDAIGFIREQQAEADANPEPVAPEPVAPSPAVVAELLSKSKQTARA